jgi:hypothetical protein
MAARRRLIAKIGASEGWTPHVDMDAENMADEMAAPDRYLLIEVGTDRDSRRWFTTHPSPLQAAEYHLSQQCPQDWRAALLVDLDTESPVLIERHFVPVLDGSTLTAWLANDPFWAEVWTDPPADEQGTREGMAPLPIVPASWPVQPCAPDAPGAATCGACGRSWDDVTPTSMTPAPSARCPFEPFHHP